MPASRPRAWASSLSRPTKLVGGRGSTPKWSHHRASAALAGLKDKIAGGDTSGVDTVQNELASAQKTPLTSADAAYTNGLLDVIDGGATLGIVGALVAIPGSRGGATAPR